MRDRLAELNQARGPEERPEAGNFTPTGDPQLARFFEQVQEIRESYDVILRNTSRIEELYAHALTSAIEEQVTREIHEAEDLMFETNRFATLVRNRLRAMKAENEEIQRAPHAERGITVDLRMREAQYAALSQKFVEIVSAYQDVQTRCKARFKERMERQYKIVRPEATEAEVENAIENTQGPIFAQQFVAANQRAEAKRALKDIQDRHTEILKLEQSLRELQQLFLDMQILVEAQGEMVNQIENSVERAVDYTEKGAAEMKRSVKLKRKARLKIIILVSCLVLLILAILIPLLVVFLPKSG